MKIQYLAAMFGEEQKMQREDSQERDMRRGGGGGILLIPRRYCGGKYVFVYCNNIVTVIMHHQ